MVQEMNSIEFDALCFGGLRVTSLNHFLTSAHLMDLYPISTSEMLYI